MTSDPEAALAIAGRLFAAVEAGDIGAVRELYHDDVRIWHNTDGVAQTGEENLRTLGWMVEYLAERRYEEVSCQPTLTGFVQQHVLRVTTLTGTRVELPACMVVTLDDGCISRIDEYFDSAQLAQLVTAMTPKEPTPD